MPRKGEYVAWSSKTVQVLRNLKNPAVDITNMEVDFRNPGKKTSNSVVLYSVDGAAGRAHREEAMLIQVLGVDNEAACGNCAWDSKDIDCTLKHVRDELAQILKEKTELRDLKDGMSKVRGNTSSKRKRVAKGPVDLTEEDGEGEEQEVTMRTTRASAGGKGAGEKKSRKRRRSGR